MKRIQDPTPELSDLENQILSGHSGDVEIGTRELDARETREEIRRWLTEGGRRKIQKGAKSEIERINRNLRDFLDNAERACGRAAIITHYRAAPANDPAVCYTHHKHRFTATSNRAMETRFELVTAACAALREAGRQVDDATACIDLFRGTDLALVVPTLRDPEILLDAGSQLSDAWWAIADGLNQECDLTGWFAHLSDKARRSVAPLASFLEVDAVVDFGRRAMADGMNLPRDRGHCAETLKLLRWEV